MKKFLYPTFAILLLSVSCKVTTVPENETPEQITSNEQGKGQEVLFKFTRGAAHNHPLMAVWTEDMQGKYIQTLFVAESLGKGIFQHGDATSGKWLPAAIRRPGALPVWAHSRGVIEKDSLFVPTPENAVPDAYTGATPKISFELNSRLDKPINVPFQVLFEINQTWDWNEYWTNNKFPDDEVYKTSCQPSLIYRAVVDPSKPGETVLLEVLGRGHHSGRDGVIYTDLETMTTALNITKEVSVEIKKED